MIIRIVQTASNIRQCYDIEGSTCHRTGEAGQFSRLQTVTLTGENETLQGKYHASHISNYIPFRYLFGIPNLTRGFDLSRNGEPVGHVLFSHCGFRESFYLITLKDDTVLRCYIVAKGHFQYACIYRCDFNGNEQQIALIETYLNVDNYKYTHKVYLLDDCKQLEPVISFFAVYYSSYHFSSRFHMSVGSVSEKRITHSKFNGKYDALWRETHFPDEDYFGQTNRFG